MEPPPARSPSSSPSSAPGQDGLGEHDVPEFPGSWRFNILLAQLLGLFPLRRTLGPGLGPGPPQRRWRLSRASQAATAFSFSTTTACVYSFSTMLNLMGRNTKVILGLLTRVSLILFGASGVPCLVSALCIGRRLERFTNSLLLLVKELRPAPEQVWPPGWALHAVAFPLAVLVVDVYREILHVSRMNPTNACIIASYLVPMTAEVQYNFFCSVLGLGFSRVAGRVRGLQAVALSPGGRELDAVRRGHEQLVALTGCLHGLFGPALLVTVFACQISLLSAAYTLASYAVEGNFSFSDRKTDMVDMVYFAARLVGVCVSAESVRSAAGGLVELSLRVDSATWSPRAQEKWFLFLAQLEFVKPSFKATGLLQIGSSMIGAVSGMTLSYLLVFLQFDSY